MVDVETGGMERDVAVHMLDLDSDSKGNMKELASALPR